MSETIERYRADLGRAIETGGDTSQAVENLIIQNVPLREKFRILDFSYLLEQNSESPASLKKFLNALGILEKYGKHLLKPAESRSNMWRHIKFSNNIFRERIQTVNCGLDIMYLMGYTEKRPDGVAFPDGVEPDHSNILNLVTDIVLGRKELELFHMSRHPYPDTIEKLVSPQIRALRKEVPGSQDTAHLQLPAGSTSAFSPYGQSIMSGSMPTFNLQSESGAEELTPDMLSSTNQMQPNTMPTASQMPAHMQQPVGHYLGQLPSVGNRMLSQMQSHGYPAMSYSYSEGNLQQGQKMDLTKQNVPRIPQNDQYVEPNLMSRPRSEQYLNQAERASALYLTPVYNQNTEPSQTEQASALYFTPVYSQNTEPRQQELYASERQNRDAVQRSQQPLQGFQHNEQLQQQLTLDVQKARELQIQDEEGKAPSIACDICGENHAVVICKACDNKQLCKDCNIKWHNHPKRQNHQLERIRPTSEDLSGQSGEAANQQRVGQDYGSQKGQVGYSFPYPIQDYPSHVGQFRPGLQYNQRNSSPSTAAQPYGRNMAETSSSGSAERQASGFMYGLHYPVSSSMMHSGQPVGMAPYPVGFYPSMYMAAPGHVPVQGYMVPAGSGAAPQLHDMSQAYLTQPGTRPDRQKSPGMLPKSANTQASSTTVEVVQNFSEAIPSTRVSQPPDVSSLGSNSSPISGSELLPGIMVITDLNKRLSRLDVSLMTLNDDLKEWEAKINHIILQNPNFFQDEEYKNLNRKKRKHLQERKELENYRGVLGKTINEKNEREAKEQEEIERKAREVETLRRRFDQIRTSTSSDHLGSPVIQEPPVVPLVGNSIDEASHSTSSEPVGPETTTYRRNISENLAQEGQYPPKTATGTGNCPDLNLNSLSDNDTTDQIKKMLVLDVNPHDPSTYKRPDQGQKQQDLGVQSAAGNQGGPTAAFGPSSNQYIGQNQFNDNKIKIKVQAPDASKLQDSVGKQDKRNTGDTAKWECNHCTFVNQFPIKACEMCYRTSVNPKCIEEKKPVKPSLTEELIKGREEGEPCEFCTVHNKPGTKVCQVCGKTQLKYDSQKPVQENDGKPSYICGAGNQRAGNKQGASSVDAGDKDVAVACAATASEVGKLIEEEQDQVYLEKKAAKERFERMNKAADTGISEETAVVEAQAGAIGGAQNDVSGTKTPDGGRLNQGTPRTKQDERDKAEVSTSLNLEKGLSPLNRDVNHLRKESSGSSGSVYNSAPSSLGETTQGSEVKTKIPEAQGPGKASKAPQLNFVEAIEQINLRREQEQMCLDGREVMRIIKEAENAGYEIPEVEIALQRCVEEKLRPLEWLRDKWVVFINTVAVTASENGKLANENDVGDVSSQEAKKALLECNGDIEKAIEKCVTERKKKYAAINERGKYAREDILAALYQNQGDVEEAIDQLNDTLLQAYAERLWEENEHGGGDAAIAAAARSQQLTNSVSNSVIKNDEFMRLVMDVNIDKERRVRMVFVEAKLKSWGRAETVINILDQDVTLSDEPLDCSLEEIIEAVRNCNGDRKSSLIFLRQECAICYALYPMSKIQSLGFCSCKVCQGCIRQHFEVAIKEKYVRNWGCPVCEIPDTEDETKAVPYFEFLQLILQNQLPKDIVEMYEMKLRDWHLQKNENFRWCAHCASGFIWDRMEVLGMTCPNCKQKTCFKCKIKWEDQHEGLTCEEFEQWKIDNDPEKQAKGVKLYLEENGIECPSCKMRYSLAKGGCMHFKCFQCGYEFCSGCSQAFVQKGTCDLLKSCKTKGFHCHHPRDCFYYLRDNDTEDLQRLLKIKKIEYNTEIPANQNDKKHCLVMEQKEYGLVKKDEPCGKDVGKGMAGLCEGHYKEYLVGLINRNKIDPVAIMTVKDLKALIARKEKDIPQQGQNESEAAYRKRLEQFVKEQWRLQR